MKKLLSIVLAAGFIALGAHTASASIYASSILDNTLASNWDVTGDGSACHGTLDISVILGAPTQAVDGTGYTGWGSGQSGYVELGFDQAFINGEGDDIFVYGFGPKTNAYISVSADGETWSDQVLLGTSGPGSAAVWGYDLSEFGVTSAQYVRIDSGMARFIDAVEAANPVPVPGAIWLMGAGLVGLAGLRRKKTELS